MVIAGRGFRALRGMALAAMLAGACGSAGAVPVDRTAACAGNPRPDLCGQAFDAVIAEIGGLPSGTRLRIDPVQCANQRCWTFAYVTSAGGGPDQQLSVDWGPDGKIGISHVVPG